jgi:hypothetical protein
MNQDLYIIFNTCGLSGRENSDAYIRSLNEILSQDTQYRIIISSCYNNEITLSKLFKEFGRKISYNIIKDVLPVNITFNHTVQKCVQNFGAAKGYLYLDSGITFGNNKIKDLYDLHVSGPYGMTAGRVSLDGGTFIWFDMGENQQDESGSDFLVREGDFIIPIGKTVNNHIQIFDHSIYENFNERIIPDIFASHCTESTFSFINASINKKFIISKKVKVDHIVSMDVASSGFRPEYSGGPAWRHLLPFSHKTIDDIINNPEAKECGFGYEECQKILMHDPNKFDDNGYAKNPERLKKFILENIYLPKSNFDYNKINHIFIP